MKEFMLWVCLLASCSAAFGQEPAKQPQPLTTEKQLITVSAKLQNAEAIKLLGEMIFQVKAINSDDTLSGKLVFQLSDKTRQLLAEKLKQPVSVIPATISDENTWAELKNPTACPAINLELAHAHFDLTTNLRITCERFNLNLRETPKEVSKLMCEYVRRVFSGRGESGGIRRKINHLLKGEATEN